MSGPGPLRGGRARQGEPLGGQEPLFGAGFVEAVRALAAAARRPRARRPQAAVGPAIGATREVRDRRAYAAGDDPRAIDWPVYAREERLFVRLYEEVREVQVEVVIDASGSMARPFPEKRRAALRLAGGLGWLALHARHRLRVSALPAPGAATGLRRELGPVRGAGQARPLLERLEAIAYGGPTDLAAAARAFEPPRGQRVRVTVVSDLLGEGLDDALDRAARWACETVVAHVVHPDEVDATTALAEARAAGGEGAPVDLVDVETGEVQRVALDAALLRRYRAAAGARIDGARHACLRRGLGYVLARTDRPLGEALGPLIAGLVAAE